MVWPLFCSKFDEQICFSNFGKVLYRNMRCEITPNLGLGFTSRCHNVNILSNFSRGNYREHFCEIILNLATLLQRCCLKIFIFLAQAAILLTFKIRFIHLCLFNNILIIKVLNSTLSQKKR